MIRFARNLFYTAVLVVLSAPLFIVAGVSVNEKKFMIFPPRGFSFRWFTEVFEKTKWSEPLTNSLIIAFSSGVIALTIALPIAYFLWRYRVTYAKALCHRVDALRSAAGYHRAGHAGLLDRASPYRPA